MDIHDKEKADAQKNLKLVFRHYIPIFFCPTLINIVPLQVLLLSGSTKLVQSVHFILWSFRFFALVNS